MSDVLLMDKIKERDKPFIATALVTLLVSSFASYTNAVIEGVVKKNGWHLHIMGHLLFNMLTTGNDIDFIDRHTWSF
jgi:hypothetical protein